ncbi:hypothetical protein [Curtobacterium ammoniigenes]|uniref:hypothetical protein n=1 Tax=Curtobacterium ammoniigenes TaxID=395387 RepID=UPI000836442C|nr:hypothetical protein [Curtobacterium ammoniigenes]
MSARHSVALSDRIPPGEAATIGWAAASLPELLRIVDDHADLSAVSGTDWAAAAARAVEEGARGVLVVRPAPPALGVDGYDDAVERLRAARTPVVVATEWAHNPAVDTARVRMQPLLQDRVHASLRVTVPTGSDTQRVLLDALALLRAAIGGIAALSTVRWDTHGFDLRGAVDDSIEVSISAVVTDAVNAGADLRLTTRQRAIRLELPTADTARPGLVTVSGPEGATGLPTEWETSDRAAWRLLAELVERGGSTSDLDDLLADIATVRHLRGA